MHQTRERCPTRRNRLAEAAENPLRYVTTDEALNRGAPYFPVAALNWAMSSAGIRPRSLTSRPWLLAQSRTWVLSAPAAAGLRWLRAERRAPVTRRAALA